MSGASPILRRVAAAATCLLLLSACAVNVTASTFGAARPRGSVLYTADGCSSCHSLNGSPSTGPTWKGLYGSRVLLTNGHTVTADAAYLTRHIVDPDALTVHGYPGSVMAQAIAAFHLARHPAEVRALVALIESDGRH
jgi:cytochrome c oxidase subunit 2